MSCKIEFSLGHFVFHLIAIVVNHSLVTPDNVTTPNNVTSNVNVTQKFADNVTTDNVTTIMPIMQQVCFTPFYKS